MLPIDCRRGLQRPHERGEEVHIRKGTGDDLLHCMRVSYTERAFPLQEYGQERVTAGVVFTYRCDAVAGVIAVEPEQRLPDAVGSLFE
jgi:hypothetical protein